jgi:hypothetical protein
MTRARRVGTTVAKELLAAELEDSNRGAEFEESDDELDAIELTPEDLYEDTAPIDDDEEYGNVDEAVKVAETAIAKSGVVYVIYRGLKSGARSPVAITVTVPSDRTKADDPKTVITEGETYQMRPGVPVAVTAKEAKWLCNHPAYYIEKS